MALRKSTLLLGTMLSAAFAVEAHAQASPSAFTSATRYDAGRRVTGTIAPDPDGSGPLGYAATRNTYDAAGRLTKVETGELAAWQSEAVAPASWSGFSVLQVQEIGYDQLGRKARESLSSPGGTVHSLVQTSYDAFDRVACTAQRMNRATLATVTAGACELGQQGTPPENYGPDRIVRNVYDAAGQLVQVREAVGTNVEAVEATFAYTDNGQKKFVIDGNGNRAELRYDGHDRLERWVFPSKAELPPTGPNAYNDFDQTTAIATAGALNEADYEEYKYDANGNRTELRKRDGQLILASFDALNRLTYKDLPGTKDVAYSYDLQGHQLSAAFTSTGESVSAGFDKAGRATSSSSTMGGVTRTVSAVLDANGNRSELGTSSGYSITFALDGLNG
jgi:YD repeat-containing protein